MTESKCSICWEIKKRPALQPVTDTIEALIREHVYSGYSRQIEAYSDKICGNCKNNLYKVDKNKTVPSCWLLARLCEEGISNLLIRRYQSIKKSICCRFHCYK